MTRLFEWELPAASLRVPTRKDCHPSLLQNPNVALRSLEGTLHHVHAIVLRHSSGLFDTMFDLPQPRRDGRDRRSIEVIDVFEEDTALSCMLSLFSGCPIPKWTSLDEAEAVLRLAEKWDCLAVITGIRSSPQFSSMLPTHPLQFYALARYFGWKKEAQTASRYTLSIDLFNPTNFPTMNGMSPADFSVLVEFRRRRCNLFRRLMNSPQRFPTGNSPSYFCPRCCIVQKQDQFWVDLRDVIILEFERRPDGGTLPALIDGSMSSPEAEACWNSSCDQALCMYPKFDKMITLRQIKACLEVLPDTIE